MVAAMVVEIENWNLSVELSIYQGFIGKFLDKQRIFSQIGV